MPRRRYQTAWEFVDALKANGFVANEWDDMIGYYYGVCYEEKPPSETLENQFMDRILALTETTSVEKT